VDDWAAACKGETWAETVASLHSVRAVVETFERAPGSQINRSKSALVPPRRLSDDELQMCRSRWSDLRVSSRERLLGLYIGLDATIDDQYNHPMEKFAATLERFEACRERMSLAMRILATNVFLWSLFSFVNRHFFMPQRLLTQVQSKVLRFLTPVPWARLGLFCHLKAMYSIRVQLQDLRLLNVALILAAFRCQRETSSIVTAQLGAMHSAYSTSASVRLRGTSCIRPVWLRAHEFFRTATADWPEVVVTSNMRSSNAASRERPLIFRWLYQRLQCAEEPWWRLYLANRVRRRGWEVGPFQNGFASMPMSLPQGQRWHLLRIHLNGHYTTARVHAAAVTTTAGECPFCRNSPDTILHLMECHHVIGVFHTLGRHLPGPLGRVEMADLFFQRHQDGAVRAFIVATFSAVWAVRGQCRELGASIDPDQLVALVTKILDCPWVTSSLPTHTRRERRAARARSPSPVPGAEIFRSDGASRRGRQGRAPRAGWGAAHWSSAGVLVEMARGSLNDGASNNEAEYHGLIANLRRAVALSSSISFVVFEVDSLVVARQVQQFGIGKFACRSSVLRPLFQVSTRLGLQLTTRGVQWRIRHIYREYNQVADTLANEAIDVGNADWAAAS